MFQRGKSLDKHIKLLAMNVCLYLKKGVVYLECAV